MCVARARGGTFQRPGITVIDAPGDELRGRDTQGAPLHPGPAPVIPPECSGIPRPRPGPRAPWVTGVCETNNETK